MENVSEFYLLAIKILTKENFWILLLVRLIIGEAVFSSTVEVNFKIWYLLKGNFMLFHRMFDSIPCDARYWRHNLKDTPTKSNSVFLRIFAPNFKHNIKLSVYYSLSHSVYVSVLPQNAETLSQIPITRHR